MKHYQPGNISPSEEKKLWEKYAKTKDIEIRNFFIQQYAPLVKYVVGKLMIGFPEQVEFDELISWGTFGLIDAIDKFNIKKNVQFKTYAVSRIKGAILDELRKIDWAPRSIRQKMREFQSVLNELETTLGRAPTDEEIAERLGISQKELGDLLMKMSGTIVMSLSETFYSSKNESDELQLQDIVEAPDSANPEIKTQQEEIKQIIASAMKSLPEKELQVLVLYYHEDLTLKEIGEVMEITESRVSQLHTKALMRLRANPKIAQLKIPLFGK